jgi:hypothetical protein
VRFSILHAEGQDFVMADEDDLRTYISLLGSVIDVARSTSDEASRSSAE